jgi:eukaryotic-like serine/threonine-protein kinase
LFQDVSIRHGNGIQFFPDMIQKLGRYELIRVLGKGAMGLVYEGRDPNLDRRVAIKTIKVENLSEEAAAEYEVRFRTEAHSAARLQHPNIVSVYDSDRDGDIAYMVMEFIQGDDLKHYLDQGALYTLEQTLGIMQDLLSALGYAHAQSIVHRDIKPANLLIEKSGRVKLTDFGVARIQDSGEATRTQGTMVGTLKYMSPEQVQGRPVDARADIFAAGIVLYQLLTGKRPFDGATDFAIIQQIVGHTPVAPTIYNTKLPPAIDAVVARALTKVREQRYATAKEFMAALQAASREAADPTVVPPASPRLSGMPGANGTWTSTVRPGEALVGTQPGLQSGSGVGQSTVTQEIELVYWKDIKDSMDVEDLQGFMAKFPDGIYADLARRRLRKLGVGGGDESNIGMGSSVGTGTLVLPRRVAGFEPTMLLEQGQTLDSTPVLAGTAENRGAAESSQSTHFLDDAASTLIHHTEELSWAETQIASRAPEAHTDLDNRQHRALQAEPMLPVKPFVAEASVVPRRHGPGTAKVSMPTAAPSGRHSRRLMAIAAGVLLLVGAGFGISRFAASSSPAVALAEPAAATTAAAGPPVNVSAAAAATAAVLASVSKPAAESVTASPASASSISPAEAATAGPAPVAPAPSVSKTPAELKAEAKAEARAAKKAALEKEKLAKQAQATSVAAAANPSDADSAAAKHAATPPPAAAPAVVAAADGNPKQACQDRILLGFQICMAEQCAKRAFSGHPVCVERHAMDERRRETEQSRR